MLRASSQSNDVTADLGQIVGAGEGGSTIPHAAELVEFVEASVSGEPELVDRARQALAEATDHATVVDTAAVVANFEMMTRIADGTGTTQVQTRLEQFGDLPTELGLDTFVSARGL